MLFSLFEDEDDDEDDSDPFPTVSSDDVDEVNMAVSPMKEVRQPRLSIERRSDDEEEDDDDIDNADDDEFDEVRKRRGTGESFPMIGPTPRHTPNK